MAVNHGELPKVHHCDHDISGAGCDKPARLRHQRRAKGFLSRSLQGRRWTRTAGRLTTNHGGCGKVSGINLMFGMVTGYRLQLGLRGIIYFAPRVTGYKVTRGVAGIN